MTIPKGLHVVGTDDPPATSGAVGLTDAERWELDHLDGATLSGLAAGRLTAMRTRATAGEAALIDRLLAERPPVRLSPISEEQQEAARQAMEQGRAAGRDTPAVGDFPSDRSVAEMRSRIAPHIVGHRPPGPGRIVSLDEVVNGPRMEPGRVRRLAELAAAQRSTPPPAS